MFGKKDRFSGVKNPITDMATGYPLPIKLIVKKYSEKMLEKSGVYVNEDKLRSRHKDRLKQFEKAASKIGPTRSDL